jgi:hypothetical protein
MGNFNISDFFIYRWRYAIGYGLIAGGLIAILVFAGMFLPGGLSVGEIESVIHSSSITLSDFWSVNAINLPYHLTQNISLALFGVSVFSIKLPSLIFAFLSTVGLVLLLRQWFRGRIAILASLIAIATGQFLFIAQNGTPDIMYIFWPVWIILIASLIPTNQKYRKYLKFAFFILAAFSLYTPLSLYILLVIIGAIVLHPHLRFTIKQLSCLQMTLGTIALLIITSPLILTIVKTPDIGFKLLGIPTALPDIGANLAKLGREFFGFTGTGNLNVITPVFELGSLLLIALGIYYVIKTRVTAKSYLVMIWALILIPVVILNPNYSAVTFVPLVILLASGLNGLLSSWYGLFPRNPYARVGGLIPIIIMVFILVSSGMNRYIYGYTYDPDIVNNFSKDIRLIPKEAKYIVVDSSELAFYKVLAKHNKSLVISTSPDPGADTFLATKKARDSVRGHKIDKIITGSLKNDSDRFYLYKKTAS